uniref:RNA-dependent RNA polymerase n=1 Tax=Rhizoctonia cerealis duamitovirus TaxID=3068666 RepID=A0AA51BSB4_9VIRU|nr:MAG: RNA-dependent RNA polymerase [Rhizoctonia cerealis duamitovirus]
MWLVERSRCLKQPTKLTMIITFAIITAILSMLALISLVLTRMMVSLFRLHPAVKRIVNSLPMVTSRVNTLSAKVVKLQSGPFGNKGQTRKFSTSDRVLAGGLKPSSKLVGGSLTQGPVIDKAPKKVKGAFLKQLSRFKYVIKNNVNAMASVKGGWPLLRLVIVLLPLVGLHTTSARVRGLYCFLKFLSKRVYHNGPKGACLTLKVMSVILQQSLGGMVIPDMTELKFRVSRTNRGLPRVIPVEHRKEIRGGNTSLARFYLSLFSIYRLMTFDGNYDMNALTKTIVTPIKDLMSFNHILGELKTFIPVFWRMLGREIGMNSASLGIELRRMYEELTLTPLLKSSPSTASIKLEGDIKVSELSPLELMEESDLTPTVSSHPLSVVVSGVRLATNPELGPNIMFFLDLLPDKHPVRLLWLHCKSINLDWNLVPNLTLSLGKLSLKQEAAGKVRVFAMVDPWTQWLLKPLHTVIFDHVLKGLDQDGTMDQIKPIRNLLQKGSNRYLASFDLSAATDRLSVLLQEKLLVPLVGPEFASNWRSLLVNRDYSIAVPKQFSGGVKQKTVRYAVGQPMGALSSWAMLALTHHFIVQYCAYIERVMPVRKGLPIWFDGYAVLGDDIVIANKQVANRYKLVMASLGVTIGLAKSLVSPYGTALEFAKRTFWNGVDVSPISFVEIQMAFTHPAGAVDFIKKYSLSLAAFLKAAGYRFNVLGGLNKPLGKLNSKVRLLVLALNTPVSVEEINDFFTLGMPRSGIGLVETKEMIDLLVSKELVRMKRALNELRQKLYTLELDVLRAKYIAEKLDSLQDKHLVRYPFKFLYALVKDIMFMTNSHAKSTALVQTEFISGQLTATMLHRYDLTIAQLFESLIGLQKDVANLPINSLSYVRVLEGSERTLTDTVYIRLWKSLSGYLQGTKSLPNRVPFGIGF